MAADISPLLAGDANAFEQLCSLLMSSQNKQRSQVGQLAHRGGACTPAAGG